MTIKEIEEIFAQNEKISTELLAACQNDARKSVQRIWQRYQRQQSEEARVRSMYKYEDLCRQDGYEIVAGTDEAGRGPLAGPVAAAAVILPSHIIIPKLNDSKKLSAATRDALYEEIKEKAVDYRVIMVEPREIEQNNILVATQTAMHDAVCALNPTPQIVITDAVKIPNLTMRYWPIIRGDSLSASVAAASILAKVERDRKMAEYDKIYPLYGFAKHKGYGTAEHIAAIRKYGPCPIHRKTFEPIRSMLTAKEFERKCAPLPLEK